MTHSGGAVISYTYDAAGNRLSKTVTLPASSDTTPPSGSISINGGNQYTNSASLSLTLSAVDNADVTHMRFSENGTLWEPWVPYAASSVRTVLNTNGTKTAFVMFRDGAGNLSPAYSDSIILDTTSPSFTVNPIATPVSGESLTLTGTVEEGATVTVATDTAASDGPAVVTGASWSYTITGLAEGENIITVTATDIAGNTASETLAITRNSSGLQQMDPLSIYLFYRMLHN